MNRKPIAVLVLAGTLFAGTLLGVSKARADNPNAVQVTVNCDNARSFETTLPPFGEAAPVIGSTSNFVVVSLSYADASGLHVLHSSNADPKGQPLVTCHSVGPITGNQYTLVGFFTPVGP